MRTRRNIPASHTHSPLPPSSDADRGTDGLQTGLWRTSRLGPVTPIRYQSPVRRAPGLSLSKTSACSGQASHQSLLTPARPPLAPSPISPGDPGLGAPLLTKLRRRQFRHAGANRRRRCETPFRIRRRWRYYAGSRRNLGCCLVRGYRVRSVNYSANRR
jgi:hypothetical protein